MHDSRAVRAALVAAGFLSVALGIAGIVLPLLPTTPFMLLAASVTFFVKPPWLKASLALFGVALAIRLYRIPSRDRPARGRPPAER